MATLMTFVRYEAGFLLTALAAIVVYKILTGRITMRGLLNDEHGAFSPGRLQLLLFTLAMASHLLSQIVNSTAGAVPGNPAHFPVLDHKLLLALFGSHSLYLGGKTYSLHQTNLIQSAQKIESDAVKFHSK